MKLLWGAAILTVGLTSQVCLGQTRKSIAMATAEPAAGTAAAPRIAVENAPAPLYDDPVWHGASDLTVVWLPGKGEKGEYWMYYTQRRATLPNPHGVDWVHGSAIGIAVSRDGLHWTYGGAAEGAFKDGGATKSLSNPVRDQVTWWAPDVFWEKGNGVSGGGAPGDRLHMFVTCVHGIFTNWAGESTIEDFTSVDGLHWNYVSSLPLASRHVIDPTVYKINDRWNLWYKNEAAGSRTYQATSRDLTTWKDQGDANIGGGHEAPFVWHWEGAYWDLQDMGRALDSWRSEDGLTNWTANTVLLDQNTIGTRTLDQGAGHHPWIVLQSRSAAPVTPDNEQLVLFYFTHNGKKTYIHMAEITLNAEGKLVCDRNKYASLVTTPTTASALSADSSPKPEQIRMAWGDQSDGTFVNPVLPADYSDIDAIRVNDDFYAISSTFQFSPGMVILHSKDLVNWTLVGHAIPDLTPISPELNWDRMNGYGRGVWAGAIRHHAGRYWIYFGTPDEGLFMTSAENPAGPWEKPVRVMDARGWDDCCPFWDDDGQGYLVCTNFSDNYKIHLFRLTADGKGLIKGYDRVIHQSRGSEANKLYKIHGMYYHYFSEVRGEGRVAMMGRAKSLEGPWEVRQVNHVNKKSDREPNQGGLIELANGQWWFLTHQGTGDWDGRAMCLLPVTWTDGWPVIGAPGEDGIGNMVWRAGKPIAGQPKMQPQASDTFDGEALGAQWEWNYQPRGDKWSLKARPGFLRLEAFRPLRAGDLLKAGNTLTQRVWRGEKCEAVLAMDIAGMADGQRAGLCHFAKVYSMIGVMQEGESRRLFVEADGKTTRGPSLEGVVVWLRTEWTFDGMSQYSWSTDGKTFTSLGPPCELTWSYYRGDRLGIFNFNDRSDRGFVDVDSFMCDFL